MANIYKVEMYIVDANGEYGSVEDIECRINCELNCSHEITSINKAGFEWDDNLPINKIGCDKEQYEKYFK